MGMGMAGKGWGGIPEPPRSGYGMGPYGRGGQPPAPPWASPGGCGGYGGYGGGCDGYGCGYSGKGAKRSLDDAPQGVLVLEMPNELAGCIIGRGGSTISAIRRDCGGRLEVREASRYGGSERVLVIDGSEDEVDRLVVEVFEQLKRPSGRDPADFAEDRPIEVTLVAQSFQMGAIIGHGGKNIARIRDQAGAKIRVDSGNSMLKDSERTAQFSGTPDQVKRALREAARTLFDEGKAVIGRGKGDGRGPYEDGDFKRRREDRPERW